MSESIGCFCIAELRNARFHFLTFRPLNAAIMWGIHIFFVLVPQPSELPYEKCFRPDPTWIPRILLRLWPECLGRKPEVIE